MTPPVRTVGSMVNNPQFTRGIRVVESRDGLISLTYIENSDSPFRSPVIVERTFDSWNGVTHFLALWESLSYVQWW